MPYRDGFSTFRKTPLVALLLLGACATDTLHLAPADPRVPWPIEPPPVEQSSAALSTAADRTGPGLAPTRATTPLSLIPRDVTIWPH